MDNGESEEEVIGVAHLALIIDTLSIEQGGGYNESA